ncbi:unnamed protein product [Meloidogyne enterolobii]|uniref:Uncharacterized protein n=1 Tax=Meloidogyne enterolobii TaxID=390850 RepID=A0ACB0YG18_MELEN
MSQIIPEYNPLIPPPALPLSTQTQPVSAFPEQLLWKLVKGKTVLQYHLCFECQDRLFHSSDKVVRKGENVVIKIELCNNCVKDNCHATDLLSNKKKNYEKKI